MDNVRARLDADRRVYAWATVSAESHGASSHVSISVSVVNRTDYPLIGSHITVWLPEWATYRNQPVAPEMLPPGETRVLSRGFSIERGGIVHNTEAVPVVIAFRDPSGELCARRADGRLSVGELGPEPLRAPAPVWAPDPEPSGGRRWWPWRRNGHGP